MSTVKSPDQDDAHRGGPENLMVVMDHHGAKIFEFDIRSHDASEHTIRPYDPHGLMHHLTHKKESHDQGGRTPEEASFYDAIAKTVVSAARIVVVGHGTGKSNAAHHLIEFLHKHHPDTARHVAHEISADLSSLTERQMLDVGRRALTDASKGL